MLAIIWGFLAPWLGPVVVRVLPFVARIKSAFGGVGSLIVPFAGFAILLATIGFGVWLIHERREGLRSEGEARCVTKVADVTIEQLRAEQERRQQAELAANAAREEALLAEAAFSAKVADLERELGERPPKGLCYPADIAKRLNQ